MVLVAEENLLRLNQQETPLEQEEITIAVPAPVETNSELTSEERALYNVSEELRNTLSTSPGDFSRNSAALVHNYNLLEAQLGKDKALEISKAIITGVPTDFKTSYEAALTAGRLANRQPGEFSTEEFFEINKARIAINRFDGIIGEERVTANSVQEYFSGGEHVTGISASLGSGIIREQSINESAEATRARLEANIAVNHILDFHGQDVDYSAHADALRAKLELERNSGDLLPEREGRLLSEISISHALAGEVSDALAVTNQLKVLSESAEQISGLTQQTEAAVRSLGLNSVGRSIQLEASAAEQLESSYAGHDEITSRLNPDKVTDKFSGLFTGGLGMDLARTSGAFDDPLAVADSMRESARSRMGGLELAREMNSLGYSGKEIEQFAAGQWPDDKWSQLADAHAVNLTEEQISANSDINLPSALVETNGSPALFEGVPLESIRLNTDTYRFETTDGNEVDNEKFIRQFPNLSQELLQNQLTPLRLYNINTEARHIDDNLHLVTGDVRANARESLRERQSALQELLTGEDYGSDLQKIIGNEEIPSTELYADESLGIEEGIQAQQYLETAEENKFRVFGSRNIAETLRFVDNGINPGSFSAGLLMGGASGVALDPVIDTATGGASMALGINPNENAAIAMLGSLPAGAVVSRLGRSIVALDSLNLPKQGQNLRLNIIDEGGSPNLYFEGAHSVPPHTLNAHAVIDGRRVEVPRNGRLEIGDNHYLERDGTFYRLHENGEAQIPPYSIPGYERNISVDGRNISVRMEDPIYSEINGIPRIQVAHYNSPEYKEWFKNHDINSTGRSYRNEQEQFVKWADTQLHVPGQKGFEAHGVEWNKGGLENLVSIAATRRIGTHADNGPGYWGPLTGNYSNWSSGGHGPFYVVKRPDESYDPDTWKFVLPDNESKSHFEKAIRQLSDEGVIGPRDVDWTLSRTYTYDEFRSAASEIP